ncbi:Hypothetical predicted protein [Podarcis lilfordi]|uniref:Uncharacterized protein n=1 Tax=Podarcis lilfordi TaxID=74358 RepID=A0AA35JZR0_9SAUR|nr:Hypothetical predicted protein [Podarcis lilfordi]
MLFCNCRFFAIWKVHAQSGSPGPASGTKSVPPSESKGSHSSHNRVSSNKPLPDVVEVASPHDQILPARKRWTVAIVPHLMRHWCVGVESHRSALEQIHFQNILC